jgi:exosortase/archaeosortase family protein
MVVDLFTIFKHFVGMAHQNLVNTLQNLKKHWFSSLILGTCAAIFVYWCYIGYIFTDNSLYAGVMLAPFVVLVRQPLTGASYRFGILAALFMGFSMLLPNRTFHFFALAFTILFVLENWLGRLNSLPFFLIIFMSSLVKNWVVVFGFPLRLQLSAFASKILSTIGFDAHSEGNVIVSNGENFSVDPACMGLSMVQISLLFGLAIMAIFERKTTKKLPFWSICVVLLMVFGLNIFYNLLRILLLVLMHWMPGTAMHEIGGLVGLGLYVFLPTWFLVRLFYFLLGVKEKVFLKKNTLDSNWNADDADLAEKSGFLRNLTKKIRFNPLNPLNPRSNYYLMGTLLFTGILWISFHETNHAKATHQTQYPTLDLKLQKENFKEKKLAHGVVQSVSDSILIYVKPIQGFYSAEHTPLICWEGNGYEFSATNEKTLPNGQKYYTGLLKKGTETIHTAWWYSNGTTQTTSQWTWRWLDLKGESDFFLINISANEAEVLENWVIKHFFL